MFDAKKRLFLLSQVVVWALVTAFAFGQAAPPKRMSDTELTELLQARLKQTDEQSDLDDATKSKVKELYQQALTEMHAAKKWAEKTAQNERSALDAPREFDQTKAELAALPAQATSNIPIEATVPQIEQMISKREAELEKLQKALTDDEADLKGSTGRRAKISGQITAAKDQLTKINEQLQQLQVSPPADENPAVIFARRMVLIAQQRVEEQQISCCEKELVAYEARADLLPLRRDLDARKTALADQEIKQYQAIVNSRRRQETEQQVERASWEANKAHPAVRQLAEDNAELARMRKPLADQILDVTRQREKVNLERNKLKEQFTRVKEKVEATGKTNTTYMIGLKLRELRDLLPKLYDYQRNADLRQQTMRDTQLELLQWQDVRATLADLDLQTQNVVQGLSAMQQIGDQAELEKEVRQALQTKQNYLDALITDKRTYFEKVVDLDTAEKELCAQIEECARYIDERVLWIASSGALSSADIRNTAEAAWWLAGPEAWYDLGKTLLTDAQKYPALLILASIIFLSLIYCRSRFRARHVEIGEKAARGSCCLFVPTLEAFVLTVLIAALWPGFMWYVGFRLTNAADASELCTAWGHGLTETARVFLALNLLFHLCGPRGLAESHFGWPVSALKLIRHNVRWICMPVLLPLMGIAVAMAWQYNNHWDASLGRICFTIAMFGFAWALHRVLRPTSVVFQAMIASRRDGWAEKFRYVWYPLCVLTPTALGILAAVGYHYTSRQLVIRLILSVYVLVGGIVCRALLFRWTLVNQRKLAIEQARQRRAAAQSENAGEEATPLADLPTVAASERDLAVINTQTRRFIEYSLGVACALVIWCAWVDVLPALGSLNVQVGSTIVTVNEEVNSINGEKKLEAREQLRKVTLADICLAVIILATTVTAAKNIPGLLEMAVLQHLPFDAGARYAVATVCRYLITIVGLMFCFGILGVGWSKVQWLAAAVSLGLGFGLQEIFANFVSGLIILFERPVRVGDVVTIGDISGVVSRIRIRATTITDWDRKELIIPNKEFITGRVLNWTLTDQVNRVVIKVGVAYGSDTKQAADILLNVARNHPNVMKDPAPQVALESFGDSALQFVLRCFLPNLESRGLAIHELHMAIDQAFRKASIEMPFPQQDVHVRSVDLPSSLPEQPVGAGVNRPWPPTLRPDSTEKAA